MIIAAALAVQFAGQAWQPVRSGILFGISGIALVEARDDANTFLIVHDNKREGEGRAALMTVQRGARPQYVAIAWEGSPLPVDLEGLTTVPDQKDRYVCMESSGTAFVIDLSADRAKVTVRSSFKVPDIPQGANFEALAIQKVVDTTLMAWGHRGESPAFARLFVAAVDQDLKPGIPVSAEIPVPWPAAQGTRGISDLKIDPSGTVFITSAVDAGDDGPFQSALMTSGVVGLADGKPTLRAGASTRLFWTDQHKIEAFDLVPGKTGGLVFGTDDENLGGCVWNNFWPD